MKRKLLFYLLFLIAITGCSGPTIISTWQNDEIKIDGHKEEWSGSLNFIEDEQVAVAIRNDDSYLYLCLATSDRSKTMKIMQMGLTIWLDPLNSDGKTIGIQYPLKQQREPDPNMLMDDKQNKYISESNIEKRFNNFKSKQNEIVIVNENNFPLNALPTKNIDGIEVELGNETNQLIYELRIPLTNKNINSVFIDALPGEEIKISFETGKFKKPEMNNRSPRGNIDSGIPGGGRRGGMRGGQDKMRNLGDRMDPIDFSVDVKLSQK